MVFWEGIDDDVTLMITMLLDGAEVANKLVTSVAVHFQALAMAGTLHDGLFFEWNKFRGHCSHILHTHYSVAAESCPSVVHADAGLAEKLGTMLAIAVGFFLLAILTVIFLGARYLLQQSMELQKAVDEERSLETRYSLVG